MTVEIVTAALRVFINLDIDMYHAKTDTRTIARSTTVTDLGQVQYVFSDKTGTLTQNVMVFKRCSVDGNVFGAPVINSTPGSESGELPFSDPGVEFITGAPKTLPSTEQRDRKSTRLNSSHPSISRMPSSA